MSATRFIGLTCFLIAANAVTQDQRTSSLAATKSQQPSRIRLGAQQVEALKQPSARQVVEATPAAQSHARSAASLWQSPSHAAAIQQADTQLQEAAAAGNREQQTQLSIAKAQLIESWAAVDKTKVGLYSEAIAAYRSVAGIGSPAQRALAHNNIGILMLRSGQKAQAVQEFKSITFSAVEPADRSVFHYNYGRALESSGKFATAVEQYQEALSADSTLEPAIEGAFRSLTSLIPVDYQRISKLASRLLERGSGDALARSLRTVLIRHGSDPATLAMIPVLVRYYATAPVDKARFEKSELPFLSELESGAGDWSQAIREIQLAYSGTLATTQISQGSQQFRFWSSGRDRAAAFSQLLMFTGNLQARSGHADQALAHYYAAWDVDRDNTEAIVYAAALLRDYAAEIDPQGTRLRSLLNELFHQKGEAYNERDLLNVLRLHTILGTIFEQEKRWGGEDHVESAIFQWQHAISASEQLRTERRDIPPSPALYAHLATAYAGKGMRDRAAETFLRAAEESVKLGDAEQARSFLGQAENSGTLAVDPTRVQQIKREIERIGNAS